MTAPDDYESCCTAGTGRPTPAHLLRDLPPLRPTTPDPVGQRIALLLCLHPELDREYVGVDLRRLKPPERRVMLAEIEKRLNIKPIKTRVLPYVGPTGSEEPS